MYFFTKTANKKELENEKMAPNKEKIIILVTIFACVIIGKFILDFITANYYFLVGATIAAYFRIDKFTQLVDEIILRCVERFKTLFLF